MTVLCITHLGLPGVRPCTESGVHRVTCPDHPGWAEELRPGLCWGCLPRGADRGFLCAHCYERAVAAVAAWGDFRRAVDAAEGRLVAADTGGIAGSTPGGYSNLTLTFLTISECESHLASRADQTVDLWVHDEDGAADAIQFAVTAERAFRSLEVAEHEQPVTRQRCPSCEKLTLTGNPSRDVRGTTIVECQHCGYVIDKIRTAAPRWLGSATCEHQLHADCDEVTCPCHCHLLGVQSRPGGVQALWDADQHTVAPGYRAAWTVQDALTIQPTAERTAA